MKVYELNGRNYAYQIPPNLHFASPWAKKIKQTSQNKRIIVQIEPQRFNTCHDLKKLSYAT